METKRVHVVTRNSDLTEGRGHRVVECFCEAKATADRLAEGIDVQGATGSVSEITLYRPETEDPTWKQWWYGPVEIEVPNKADRVVQKRLDAEELRTAAALKALAKAKELGLTDEDIAALRDVIPK